MFTLQSHNQVLFHLSQLSAGLKAGLQPVVLFVKQSQSSTSTNVSKTSPTAIQHEDDVICKESFNEAARHCAIKPGIKFKKICSVHVPEKEVDIEWYTTNSGLKNLSRNEVHQKMINHSVTFRSHLSRLPWLVSFTSQNSFNENKQYIMRQDDAVSSSLRLLKANGLTPQLLQSFYGTEKFAQQRRGFKTKRFLASEKEKQQNKNVFGWVWRKVFGASSASPHNVEIKLPNSADVKIPVETIQAIQKVYTDGFDAGKSSKHSSPSFFAIFLVMLLFVSGGVLFYLARQAAMMTYTEKRDSKVTFNDVKGAEEAKKELKTFVEFLQNPQKFEAMGARLPRGILLVGPPGCGKTLLAKAVANEAGVPFFYASGSQFDEALVGEGSRRVRNLFNQARAAAPCVIFLDELDSVGSARTSSRLHPYANQTINQLLTEMDGFKENEGVIVLAATNRQSDLDEALLRPGRFDLEIKIPMPRKDDRKDLLELYLGKVTTKNIDMEYLANETNGFTGASIESLINMAAIKATIQNSEYITMSHLKESIDRIKLGPEWKLPKDAPRRKTAYHEGGHAVVGHFSKHGVPVDKVTILPRGESLGHTKFVEDSDKVEKTKAEMLAQLDMMMGGRAAEELLFGLNAVTTGASQDLEVASELASLMIQRFGMGDSRIRVVKDMQQLGSEARNILDAEVEKLLQDSHERAHELLSNHKADLDKVAEALLKYDTLTGEDLEGLLGPPACHGSEADESMKHSSP